MTRPSKIYTHPLHHTTNQHPKNSHLSLLLSALSPHLPTSLSLYRRLQFEHFTSSSFLFTSLDFEGNIDNDEEEAGKEGKEKTWVVAYVDRSRRPETEVWMFGSWEGQSQSQSQSLDDGDEGAEEEEEEAKDLIRKLVCEIKRATTTATTGGGDDGVGGHGMVVMGVKDESLQNLQNSITVSNDSSDGVAAATATAAAVSAKIRNSATAVERGEYEGHLANSNIILFGSLHERTVRLMNQMGLLSREFAVGADIPYKKYLFDQSGTREKDNYSQDTNLPDDMTWGKVQPEHFSLVRSRTQIPRQDRTLRQLPSLAIFPKDGSDPIAWSFLGPDASLTSLHVEPAYRGRSLAKILANRLFANGMEAYWHGEEPKDYWSHADVALDNIASNGVCKGLGGTTSFNVYWVRVDMGNIHELD